MPFYSPMELYNQPPIEVGRWGEAFLTVNRSALSPMKTVFVISDSRPKSTLLSCKITAVQVNEMTNHMWQRNLNKLPK